MKNICRIFLTAFITFSCVSGAFAQKSSIVVFYSLTGTTKDLAERIAKETQSDLFALELIKPYPVNSKECDKASKADKQNNVQREFKAVPDISKYDTVFIGTPVWTDDISNPVETFILQNVNELSKKTVIPFCTYWSTGSTKVIEKIVALSRCKSTKNGLAQSHGKKADVKEWIKREGI